MGLGDYLGGLVWLVLDLGAVAIAAALVTRRAYGHLRGAQLVLAFALLLTTGLIAVHLVAGALGILARGSVAVIALVLLAATAWLTGRGGAEAAGDAQGRRVGAIRPWAARRWWEATRRPASPAPEPPPSDRVAWTLSAGVLVVAGLYLVGFLVDSRPHATTAIDALTFHLPGVAQWMQDGSLWPVHHWVPGWAFGNYPGNGELVQLTTVLPWRTEAFLRFTAVPYLLMAGAGTYALARELQAPRAAAAAAGGLLVTIPTTFLAALEWIKPDAVMLACFVGGAAFLARHARTRATGDLVLGALGLGIAFGTKWYGVAYAAVVLAVWAGARLLERRSRAAVVRDALVAGAVVLAAGGFWLLRNLVGSDNPFFPVKVELAGVTIFDAPPDRIREQAGFSLVDYAGDTEVWREFIVPIMRDSFALGGALAVVALLAGLVLGLRGHRRHAALAVTALAGLAVLAAYAVTPYSAFGPEGRPFLLGSAARYAVPGLAVGLAVGAALARPLGRWAAVVPALALAGVVDGLRHVADVDPSPGVAAPLGGVSLVAGLVVLVALAALARVARKRRPPRAAWAGLAAAIAAVAAVAAYVHVDDYLPDRYRGMDPAIDWISTRAPSGHRIGIVGTGTTRQVSPNLPAFGPRLRNEVEHLGPVERHVLETVDSRAELGRELAEARVDVLFVKRTDPRRPAREERWAEALGWRPVARGRNSAVLVGGGPRASR